MKASIAEKLQLLIERHEELAALLSQADIINQQQKFRQYSKEYADLEAIVSSYKHYQQAIADKTAALALLQEADTEIRELAQEELSLAEQRIEILQKDIQCLLLPKDPDDDKNVYLEIRAGTGGDEAAIFSGDLSRMYLRYAEANGWQCDVVNTNAGEHGGYKEIIIKMSGQNVYSKLKFESGAHRVQRVPATESQGRIHTSACTVAILPEVTEIDAVAIDSADLKIDTYRASGAGGQHVNKTDSAIRITHIPTGVVVECQDERSQHKNRAKAMSLLQAKLLASEQAKQRTEQAETRRDLVGSGDRSERIRTYNYPQGRVTDHRINLTLYKLDEIVEGHLEEVIEPLIQEHQAEQLAALDE